jgi:dTDP-4-amino-4,6-dideoxygalactose transaminase
VIEIPFNRPQLVGREHTYIDEALASGKLSGNGKFALRCADWLERRLGSQRALITPSCTASLEMTGILAELKPGDEVIVPDFAFVSTANAFALLGAVPVFVDIDAETLNIAADAVEDAITDKTRAIVVIHYGGVGCEMERIAAIAKENGLLLIEDAAHSLEASYRGRPLGSLGNLATLSFHETKNVQCGEGGALLVNDPSLVARAETIQEKGTDRSRFFRGEIDKYTWRDTGSSYLLSEVATAFLWAQLEHAQQITAERKLIWSRYYDALEPLGCEHSGHLFYLLLPTKELRNEALSALADRGVHTVFHYLPLHSSPGGQRYGRAAGSTEVTDDASARLLRLPVWAGMSVQQVDYVIESVQEVIGR